MFTAEFEKQSAIAIRLRPEYTHATLIHHTKDGQVIKPLTKAEEKEWKKYKESKPGSKPYLKWEEKNLRGGGPHVAPTQPQEKK